MPAPHPPEFRRRAIDLARQPGASVAQVAKDLGVSESGQSLAPLKLSEARPFRLFTCAAARFPDRDGQGILIVPRPSVSVRRPRRA